MKLSISVPCYNEEKNIPMILDRFHQVIKRSDVEVIFVNNGSTDNSQEVLEKIVARFSFAKLAQVKINQGYGYGVMEGLRAAKGDYVGWTHADMQTDPLDCLRALEIIEQQGCRKDIFVKGLRKGRPFFDVFFSFGMSLFESFYLKDFFWDINAQPNIFHRDFLMCWIDPPKDFSLDLYAFFQAKKQKYKIVRLPVLFPKRVYGRSSWNFGLRDKWKFIIRTIDFSVRLKKKVK
jgi:glycosyltransferase involved in cell wall biosynthesis